MYQFSRAIYRELAPYITERRPNVPTASNHKQVLDACEAALERLATDRHYFAKPAPERRVAAGQAAGEADRRAAARAGRPGR